MVTEPGARTPTGPLDHPGLSSTRTNIVEHYEALSSIKKILGHFGVVRVTFGWFVVQPSIPLKVLYELNKKKVGEICLSKPHFLVHSHT